MTKKEPTAQDSFHNEGPPRNSTPIKGISLGGFKEDDLGATPVDGSA